MFAIIAYIGFLALFFGISLALFFGLRAVKVL